MPQLYRYKLFISHAWKYSDSYNRIERFLNQANNFLWSNYSVPQLRAFGQLSKWQLKEEIRQQIRPVDCAVILGGMYVSHSEWIQFEMDFAKALGKPMIGVRPWGAQRTPLAVQISSDEIVGWNTATIVSAIRRNT